jgi:hypothetical protein
MSCRFPYIMKLRCQFVAALKDAELSCSAISGTAIGMITLSQAPLQMK